MGRKVIRTIWSNPWMSRKKFFGWTGRHWQSVVLSFVLVAVAIAAWFTQDRWMPYARRFIAFIQNKELNSREKEPEDAGTIAAPDTLALSPAAWNNIGLVTGTVVPADYVKIVSVPAIIVERPGRSQIEIAAPMTGIVTQVHPLERIAAEPGQPLFDLRLTHEGVVTAQTEFLTRLQALDVINQELDRLRNIGEGVIPGKRIIEQEYQRDEAQATLGALRQSLLLHGISEQQVAAIEETRKVLRDVTVVAPPFATNHDHAPIEHLYHVQAIHVNRGQSVSAGDLLGVLADHCLLYVEGKAFEEDADRLIEASREGKTVQVVPVSGNANSAEVLNLKIESVADHVDMASRALTFYLLLPNSLVNQSGGSTDGFVAWKYRPGQRMEARIPTSSVMKNKIVLPADAVVIDGPNAFVFEQNGENFDRIDVHVLYHDKDTVVLENDGQLAGSIIAIHGAYQMHLAMKNQAGGAVDPHAGHQH